MPRIDRTKYTKTETFQQLDAEREMVGERGDCAVKAVAVVCGVSYAVARETLAAVGRKDRRGTYTHQILGAVRKLGKTVGPEIQGRAFWNDMARESNDVDGTHPNTVYARFIRHYPGVHSNLKQATTHHMDRFPAAWKNGRTYLVFTDGHVLAVVDGVNHDHTRGRAVRISFMYEVTPPASQPGSNVA